MLDIKNGEEYRYDKFYTGKKTKEYNQRVGERIRLFREIQGLSQVELATMLGYTSTGAFSLIESGERGLNRTKLSHAAKVLDTFAEVLTADSKLTKQEILDLNKFLHIRTNPKHPKHKEMLKLLSLDK
jgi:transcriptional regulator with XRE-family HTH domain